MSHGLGISIKQPRRSNLTSDFKYVKLYLRLHVHLLKLYWSVSVCVRACVLDRPITQLSVARFS